MSKLDPYETYSRTGHKSRNDDDLISTASYSSYRSRGSSRSSRSASIFSTDRNPNDKRVSYIHPNVPLQDSVPVRQSLGAMGARESRTMRSSFEDIVPEIKSEAPYPPMLKDRLSSRMNPLNIEEQTHRMSGLALGGSFEEEDEEDEEEDEEVSRPTTSSHNRKSSKQLQLEAKHAAERRALAKQEKRKGKEVLAVRHHNTTEYNQSEQASRAFWEEYKKFSSEDIGKIHRTQDSLSLSLVPL
ncbi:hypothetical protein B7494_g4093 [Chlorociboria aeruginascens]|nr:hypothetical protein B7494_g4093 [Chlorociboria aeruginascens]